MAGGWSWLSGRVPPLITLSPWDLLVIDPGTLAASQLCTDGSCWRWECRSNCIRVQHVWASQATCIWGLSTPTGTLALGTPEFQGHSTLCSNPSIRAFPFWFSCSGTGTLSAGLYTCAGVWGACIENLPFSSFLSVQLAGVQFNAIVCNEAHCLSPEQFHLSKDPMTT